MAKSSSGNSGTSCPEHGNTMRLVYVHRPDLRFVEVSACRKSGCNFIRPVSNGGPMPRPQKKYPVIPSDRVPSELLASL